jgi:hypothetical protein
VILLEYIRGKHFKTRQFIWEVTASCINVADIEETLIKKKINKKARYFNMIFL